MLGRIWPVEGAMVKVPTYPSAMKKIGKNIITPVSVSIPPPLVSLRKKKVVNQYTAALASQH